MERVQRGQRLQERRETLEAQNEALAQANQLNALVQEVIQALVEESTCADIEQTVCDYLAASDCYQAAWIVDRPLSNQKVTHRAWAGIEETTVTAIADASTEVNTSQNVAERVIETQEVQLSQRIADNPPGDACRDQIQTHGVESLLAVPTLHKDTCYGVLEVATTQQDVFDERQQILFKDFGTTLGFAITAAQRKRALITDEAIE